jgi:autoinducer 2-binding protein LuxP
MQSLTPKKGIIMNAYIKLLLSIFLFSCGNLWANNNFWLVEEYQKQTKGEKERFIAFNKLVHSPAKKIPSAQKTPVKIMMIYPGDQVSDYWRRSKLSFEKRMKELGIKYVLIDYFTKPAALKQQARQLSKAIKNDTDYLIFTLDIKKHSTFIRQILNRRKPKLILQNITTPVKQWKENRPFLYVGFDHVIGSQMLADYYLEKNGIKGKYAVLFGTNGYVSAMRGDEFIRYVNRRSSLKMVDAYYTNFSKDKAIVATKELIRNHPDLNFIYACSTDIALGVIEVLKEKGLMGKIMTNGWGGGSSELQAITQNELDVTVMRMNDDNGVAMAEAIKLDLLQKQNEIPHVYSGDFKLVEKGIKNKQLNILKKRAFRYTKE